MYSISSLMNSHYSISDLYHTERTNIPNIINLFNKIDSQLSPKKMQYKKIKKIEDSIGYDNDYRNNNSNNETINKNINNGNSNESESLSNYIRKKIRTLIL